MQNSEHILTDTPPAADARLRYGGDEFQFGDLRLPKGDGPFPAAMFVHGGFWRSRYDLAHAGFFCAALTKAGFVTWNIEYRRVGNPGGGWPGSFEDVTAGYQFLRQLAAGKYPVDPKRIIVVGHSAGGQLALALAAHHNSMAAVVSLAGVVDLRRAWDLHLSDDAVAGFLGGPPDAVPDHYHEASPAELDISCKQLLIHGTEDDVVPVNISRSYVKQKHNREKVSLLEIPKAGHFEIVDPESKIWPQVQRSIMTLFTFASFVRPSY